MGDRSFQSSISRAEGIDHRAVFFQIVVKFREIRTKFIHVTAALHLRRYRIALFKNGSGCHFNKCLVNGVLQRSRYRIRDLRSNGIALLILIIDQRRILEIIRKCIIHTVCKLIGDHNSSIIFSCFHTLFCFFLCVRKNPFYAGIRMQTLQNGFSHIYHGTVL